MSEGPSETSTESVRTQSPSVDDDERCVVCNKLDAENMLLCDKCEKGYHTGCIGLDHVPEEELWFCDSCIDATSVRTSTKFYFRCAGSRSALLQVDIKVRACSPETKTQIRALLVTEDKAPTPASLYRCWICNLGPKQTKARVEEFVGHLKTAHKDHELVPQILKYQKIHLLVRSET